MQRLHHHRPFPADDERSLKRLCLSTLPFVEPDLSAQAAVLDMPTPGKHRNLGINNTGASVLLHTLPLCFEFKRMATDTNAWPTDRLPIPPKPSSLAQHTFPSKVHPHSAVGCVPQTSEHDGSASDPIEDATPTNPRDSAAYCDDAEEEAEWSPEEQRCHAIASHPAMLTEIAGWFHTPLIEEAPSLEGQDKKDSEYFRQVRDKVRHYCTSMANKSKTNPTRKKFWKKKWASQTCDDKIDRTQRMRQAQKGTLTPKQSSDLLELVDWFKSQHTRGFDAKKKCHAHASGKGLMMTIMGPWSDVPRPNSTGVQGSDNLTLFESDDAMLDYVRKSQSFVQYWAKVIDYVRTISAIHKVNCHTISAEVCMDTYKNHKRLKWHVHVMMHRSDMSRIYLAEPLVFEKSEIYVKMTRSDAKLKESPICRGHYYSAVDKVGTLKTAWSESATPHKSYGVQGQWIVKLWSLGKLTDEVATKEHLASGQRCKQYIDNIEYVAEKRDEIILREHSNTLARDFEYDMGPLIIPYIVQQWLQSFDSFQKRYKFLVLCGDSLAGKTCFAKRLEQSHLEVNCAGTDTPNLRRFKCLKHKLVLWDEATPKLVIQHKKIFQAGTNIEECGPSATGCHSYYRLFHGVKHVVCANDWEAQLKSLKSEDHQWIKDNQVYVHINKGDLY